jgi:hypothetical protein
MTESMTPDPLRAARQRGRQVALALFNHRENLPLEEAAARSGRPALAIEAASVRGECYALVLFHGPLGRRYPAWQFAVSPERLAAVLRPFAQTQENCYVLHQFLLTAHPALGGRTPAQVIANSRADLETVLTLAARLRGSADQGAT